MFDGKSTLHGGASAEEPSSAALSPRLRLGISIQAISNSGLVRQGTVFAFEEEASFCPGGLTILKRPATADHSNLSILVGDTIEDWSVLETPGNSPNAKSEESEMPPLEIQPPPSKATASTRESDTAASFVLDKLNIGEAVTKPAQKLYDKFSKQFPKDTRWFKQGDSQDIVVLGVRVKYPFSAANCEIEQSEGGKSLERICNMVTKLIDSEPSPHNSLRSV